MIKFESTRIPTIHADELDVVTEMLTVFDRITFNQLGYMVAQMTIEVPILGRLTVSLFIGESHLKIYRGDLNKDAVECFTGDVWDGYLHELGDVRIAGGKLCRDKLVAAVRRKLRDRIIETI